MLSRAATIERPNARSWAIGWTLLAYLAVALAAFLPRIWTLGLFLNGDEALFWINRSQTFLNDLRAGDFGATAISTHPGVTTMWLGSAGLLLQKALFENGLVTDYSYQTWLALVRFPLILTHTAAIIFGFHLLRRLFAPAAALLAALLWALDPFVIGYSRILHVDALAASFITLCLLTACVYWHHDRRARWLIASGIAAGLAMLSKSPAVSLVAGVGAIGVLDAWRSWNAWRKAGEPAGPRRLLLVLRPLLAWAAICALTIFAFWPVMWVGPVTAYREIKLGITAEGARPHQWGNYFLGEEDDAPGYSFYLVTVALRLTPITLVGLLLLPFVWWRAGVRERRDLAALACYAVIFITAMSLFPKKLNRYMVPIFPALDILAGFALATGAAWLFSARRVPRRLAAAGVAGVLAAAIAGSALNVAYWHPYDLLAFNQVLGGAQAGARAFKLGTGEGMDQVAEWLNQQPDITGVIVASPMTIALQPYLRDGAQSDAPDGALPKNAGYVVVYIRQTQMSAPTPPFDQFYGHETPLHTVRIHGIDYAWIYQAPPSLEQARPADFASTVRLRGFDHEGTPKPGGELRYRLSWKPLAPAPTDYMLFAHLIGPDGKRYAQVDLPYPTSQWQMGRYIPTELPLALPAEMPAGRYRLFVGLYDPASGQRLPLAAGQAADPAFDGPNALLLDEPVIGR